MSLLVLKDLYYLNKNTIKKTINLLTKNWPFIFTGFAYMIINIILGLIIGILFSGVLRIIGGILLAVAMAALISNYLYLLQTIIRTEKLTISDFKYGFKALLGKVYGVLIIWWISSLLFSWIISPILGSISYVVSTVIPILLLVVLNALPESIYLKYYAPWDTIVYSFNFLKENWIEWLLPNSILIVVMYIISGKIAFQLFSIRFVSNLNISINTIISFIIGQLVFSFIMIYRGVLFESLSTSTRRKRIYMRDLYK